MKSYCLYKDVCGGDSCKRCNSPLTKTDVKRKLKELDRPNCDNAHLRQVYTELLKKAR